MPYTKKRGALPSSRATLAAAHPFVPSQGLIGTIPSNSFFIPNKISMWGNDVDGDCVSAQEAATVAAYDDDFVTDATLIAWAEKHGVLNGAVISDVLGWRTTDPLVSQSGVSYLDGPASSVDWTSPATFQAALFQGPLALGVSADQLETAVNATNDASGWFLTGAQPDSNYDHCIPALGYGTVGQCYAAIQSVFPNVIMPAAATAVQNQPGYVLFTWDSLGVADATSLVNITGEAWLRTPTTIPGPTPVPTPPAPTPVPTPPAPPPAGSVNLPDGTYVITSTATGTTFAPAVAPAPSGTPVVSIVANADGTGTLTAGTVVLTLTAVELGAIESLVALVAGKSGPFVGLTPAQIAAWIQLFQVLLSLLPTILPILPNLLGPK